MRNHTLNLFRISNLPNLDFSFRLITFELRAYEGKSDLYNKHLQKIVQEVSSAIGGPAALLKREGKYYVAIPSDYSFEDAKINVGPLIIALKQLPEVHHIKPSELGDENLDVAYKFLDFAIRKQLAAKSTLWKLDSSHFFEKEPLPSRDDSVIQIFSGFTYKLIRLQDGHFYIMLDSTSKYVDKHRLSHYVNSANAETLGKKFIGDRFLYLNGDNWYAVELRGYGDPVGIHEFSPDGKSSHKVYDYIINKPGARQRDIKAVLKPEDLTMLYRYPGRNMESHHGAVSLAKRVYRTSDPEIKSLHSKSIKDPSRRFGLINKFIRQYFLSLEFGGMALNISKAPLQEKVYSFQLPSLKYKSGQELKVGHYTTGGNTNMRDFGAERKAYIEKYGVLNESPFDSQYLVVPVNMERSLVEAFKKNAEAQLKRLSPKFRDFKIIRYPVKDGYAATLQVQEIEKALRAQNALRGFALFILPDLVTDSKRMITTFHNALKSKFYPDLKVQCASAFQIRSYFQAYPQAGSSDLMEYKVPEMNKGKFRSYLFYLILQHLIINRKWPFALAKDSHYDIYIGVDVHDRYAGFTFFLKNGENIFFTHERVMKKMTGQRAEKLTTGLLYNKLYDKLKTFISSNCPSPNGIVIIRDGKSFDEEHQALEKVLVTLGNEGYLGSGQPKYGVVDLHKQSVFPLRIAAENNGFDKLENPKAGTYKLLNATEGFVFNTGYPFALRGSAKPLHLSLKWGNVDFIKVLEDVFCQSMLAFSAPDRSSSLPITIKLIDTLLEPLALAAELEEINEESNVMLHS